MYAQYHIDKENATKRLQAPARPLAKRRHILKVELFYLPNFIFFLQILQKNGTLSKAKIIVDGLEGVYATYRDAPLLESPELPSRLIKSRLSIKEAEKSGLEEFRRFLLRFSLKKKSFSKIHSCKFEQEIYYPYWVGYFNRKGAFDFDAVDGISGQRQGVKMKPVFMKAILANREKML
jgi:hypothetical protein